MNENKQKIIGNIIIALILSAAVIFSCYIGVYGLADFKSKRNVVTIEGKTTQQITSDLIVWTGSFDVKSADLKEGYSELEANKEKVKNYLIEKGVKEEDMVFSAISTNETYKISDNGMYTNEVESYNLSQNVTVNSTEVDKVTEISRNATELINEGIEFESYAPEYHYTKLADLKVSLLAEATKDATSRAKVIVENAGNKLGTLTHANVSSIKVAPLYSNVYDNYDYYDYYGGYRNKETSSLEKEITVVVYCIFEID